MDSSQQADQTEGDQQDALHDAQRAGLLAQHMLQIQRRAHHGNAGKEGKSKQIAGTGQRHDNTYG